MPDLVTFGESLALFQPMHGASLEGASALHSDIAGAESNVAIALSRLGLAVRWISRLGRDPFGDRIEKTLRGEGVEVRAARDESAPTALMFREMRATGHMSAYYRRQGSAMSRLAAADVTADWFAGAGWLHLTGITPALSESAREATFAAVEMARGRKLRIVFDPNLRRKLWDGELARSTLLDLASRCDVFLPGLEEAEFLLQRSGHEPEKLLLQLASLGPGLIVLKLGTGGALAWNDGKIVHSPAHKVERVIDSVGAGDAFAAGLLSILIREPDNLEPALHRANLLGALATQFPGDWQGMPALAELEQFETSAVVER